jgi:DNA (cytosine-5)-methyltransferase 1
VKLIDLFAGLGGFTEGARMAGCRVVWAANHSPQAVAVHASNHPETEHACQDLHQTDWRIVPRHDAVVASPSCQGHTPARGKVTARYDAQRSTAWAVVTAIECHRPAGAIVENVPAFQQWVLFEAWCAALRALGYSLAMHVLDAADHGVPQHRLRLFVFATRSRNPVQLRFRRRQHKPASSIIDFDAGAWTRIRSPRRAAATLERIASGRARHGDRFLVPYYGSGSGLTGRSLERPIGTITTRDRWAVIDGGRMRMLTKDENRKAMAFPAAYKLPEQHKEAVFMLGNAVPPPLARDVISTFRAAL